MLWSSILASHGYDLFILQRHLGRLPQGPQEDARAGVYGTTCGDFSDPWPVFRMLDERAQENLRRYKAKQPLLAISLPYLRLMRLPQEG